MVNSTRKQQVVVYESEFTQVNTPEEADAEIVFLQKAYRLGVYNKIFYESKSGGFHDAINDGGLENLVNQFREDASAGRFPIRYAIGMNAILENGTVNAEKFTAGTR